MSMEFSNELGTVSLSKRAVIELAAQVARKCYGVVGMAARNKKDGLVQLLLNDNLGMGIDILQTPEDETVVELHIVVQYGVNIASACQSIAHRVHYTLENLAGLKIKSVNVRVEGIRVSE